MKNMALTVLVLIPVVLCANKQGNIDSTFYRPTGYIMTEVPDSIAGGAAGVALQSDGKIVIAGLSNFEFGEGHTFLARYNTDGTLDTTFGTNGTVNETFGTTNCGAMGIAIRSDDKIIIAGYAKVSSKNQFLVARFTKDGALDETFNASGTPGYIVTDFSGLASNAGAWKVGLQSDETIVATGYVWVTGNNYRQIGVARYYNSGAHDGELITAARISITNRSIMATSMAINTSNDYVTLGGFYEPDATHSWMLAIRLKNTCTEIDATFGTSGVVAIDISGLYDMSMAAVLQSNGKTLLIGQSNCSDIDEFDGKVTLVRLETDGSVDHTFGSLGITTTSVLNYSAALAGVLDTSNNIIVGGFAGQSGINAKLLLARYSSAGIIDTTFGVNGITLTNTPTNGELVRGLVLQSDGKIVAAGGGIYFGSTEPEAQAMHGEIYRDGNDDEDYQGYAIVGRYLNGVLTLSDAQRATAYRLANQLGLGHWFDTSVDFFNLMQLKGDDFGVTRLRPQVHNITCNICS